MICQPPYRLIVLMTLLCTLPASADILRGSDAFSRPFSLSGDGAADRFILGRSFFRLPWVTAPATVTARDGLGPLFSANACQACHIGNGRGHAPQAPGDGIGAAIVTLGNRNGTLPVYGPQLQTHAVAPLQPEAAVRVRWETSVVRFPDGSERPLRRPVTEVYDWAYGEPAQPVKAGLRIAPPMIGLGLLEAIPAADIEAYARELRASGHGGTPNRVPDLATGTERLGRFGWKASEPGVHQQSMKAFAGDLGITSRLFPRDPCTEAHGECLRMAQGGDPELEPTVEDGVFFYASHLAPPPRRDEDDPDVVAGSRLFGEVGCAHCHRPRWMTGRHADFPALSGQEIHPYTDLLLHDMGEDLADGMQEGLAGPRQWRTAPLWGLGHTKTVSGAGAGFLHDGRARDFVEAILWHGGEAAPARERWMKLPAAERRRVIRFLASL